MFRSPGLAGRLDDADAGRLALHGLRGREDRTVLDVVGRHGRYGGGDIAALDGAVTDDHDFVQQFVIFTQGDVDGGSCFHLARLVTDVGDYQRGARVGLQREVAIHVGDAAVGRSFHLDAGTDDGLVGCIDHAPLHSKLLCKSTQG